jgi:hypothetical protein
MPLTPALWRQRQVDFRVRGQPGLQRELQDSQGYTEKPCLSKQTNKQSNKQTKNKTKRKYKTYSYICIYVENILIKYSVVTSQENLIPDPIQSWC